MIAELLLHHALGLALALVRVAGFVVIAPFPSASLGRTPRVVLVVALAVTVSTLGLPAPVATLDLRIAPAAAAELGCGVVMGIAFRFLCVAADVFGHAVAQAIGLSMASVMNPAVNAEDAALARALSLLGELLALAAGLHRTALRYLLHSFQVLPLGSALPSRSCLGLVDLTVRSFAVGVQLAMPVVAVCLVIHVGLAMVARAAPALQILNVGLGVLLAAGTLTLLATLPDVGQLFAAHVRTLSPSLDSLLGAMAPPP